MERQNERLGKVSSKGWVVIPARLRKRYGIRPGTFVRFRESENGLFIAPVAGDPIQACFGKLAGADSLTKALLENRSEDLKREEDTLRTG
jgi:AbrB family looped-hinge helix DNA binding protein